MNRFSPKVESKIIDVSILALTHEEPNRRRILLTRRPAGTHLGGCWELPGGKIEPVDRQRAGSRPEHAADSFSDDITDAMAANAACREAREELGLDLSPTCLRMCGRCTYAYPDRTIRFHVFLARLDADDPNALLRTDRPYTWISVDELPVWPLPAANEAITLMIMDALRKD